ncbi:MAG: DUF2974 domain-containing protein [Firmicutes bacterium]|nr:DUF2974 domain-containing protein [Bacillota bacterium]
MSDCFAYVKNAQEPLRGTNFKEVDAVVLSLLSYLHFQDFKDRTSLSEMGERAEEAAVNTRVPDLNRELLVVCGASPRYGHIRIDKYADETNLVSVEQFSAVTFFIDWETIYVAFRGTDGTIVGWQEDFELAFMDEIPAQGQAKEYLKRILKEYWWCRVIVGGHSKGGNLAVYAGMSQKKSHASRITRIFNLDGPGFKKELYETDKFKITRPKVEKIVPEYSVIGMLLEDENHYVVVKSSGNWLYQHDLYNWWVDEQTGALTYISAINEDAANINRTIFHWLDNIDEKKRSTVIESLFSIMKRTECTTIACVIENWKSHVIRLILQYRKEDKKSRVLLRKDLVTLAKDIMVANHQNRDKDDREKVRKHK